jgi:hypothetical protein
VNTIAELIAVARRDTLKDTVVKYLWSDETLLNNAYEAIQEACARASLLKRISNVEIVAGTAEYSINSTIRQIYFAKLDSSNDVLQQTTDAELSLRRGSKWRSHTGTPTHYVRRGHKITLYPAPIATDVLVISSSNNFIYPPAVTATPPDVVFDFAVDIDQQYHKDLLHWIAYKCFEFPEDRELTNHALALDHLRSFEIAFGQRKTAKFEQFAFESPMYATRIARR